jgi:hypothetical protein
VCPRECQCVVNVLLVVDVVAGVAVVAEAEVAVMSKVRTIGSWLRRWVVAGQGVRPVLLQQSFTLPTCQHGAYRPHNTDKSHTTQQC